MTHTYIYTHVIFSAKGFEQDLTTNATVEKAYPCTNCGKIYKSQGGVSNHKNYECGMEAKFFCQFCDYKTKRKGNLKAHLFIKHGNETR